MKIFSGIQPSGALHIGHYLGAIQQWKELQKNNDALFCIVDMHAITAPQEPEELRKRIFEVAGLFLASGIDPQKSIIFQQSDVPAHAELHWILNTIAPLGELERMTQFKDKASKAKSLCAGLLNYPTLQAADILLYGTDEVPVGEDQAQHIEFTRMIAEKFNARFGETFKLPKAKVVKEGARIMSLQDPLKKMSKSDPDPDSYLALLDDGATIMKKLKKAVTDSGKEVRYDKEKKPAISNLMTIYQAFSGKSYKEIEEAYKGKQYSEFKSMLAEILTHSLMPIKEKYTMLSERPSEVKAVLLEGKEKASIIAEKTLAKVYQKIGFTL
ncbi:MAG: tryptophan--tRNA ligase [Patescibacteria group bacterium]